MAWLWTAIVVVLRGPAIHTTGPPNPTPSSVLKATKRSGCPESSGQELEDNRTLELRIVGLVDNTHPAVTELLGDAVVGDGLADHVGPILPLCGLLSSKERAARAGRGVT